jgi:hypothetical protein
MNLFGRFESLLPAKKIDIFGRGGWMKTSLPYYLLFSIALLAYFIIASHSWLLIVIIYAVIPLIDEIFIDDAKNPTEEERQ